MKSILKKTVNGLALFAVLFGIVLAGSALIGSDAFAAEDWEKALESVGDEQSVSVQYKDSGCSLNCDPSSSVMKKKDVMDFAKDHKIISITPLEDGGDAVVEIDGKAETAVEPQEEAPAEETGSTETITEPTVTEAEWIDGEGESALFTITGIVPKELVDKGWKAEEFYLNVGGDATPDSWIGIQTAQEGVDMVSTMNPDGSMTVKWKGTFYIPEGSLAGSDEASVSFSIHDENYSEEIVSTSVKLKKGQ